MSEYCDIFPEDPTCAVEEEEVVVEEEETAVVDDEETADVEGDNEEADAEGDMDEMKEEMEEEMMEKMEKMDWDMTPSQMLMKAGDLMKFASIDPFMGEITYMMVAVGMATKTGLDLFRYKSDSTYYDTYQSAMLSTSTNWFKIGDTIKKWAYFVIYSIAAVTQILAGFGIAAPINYLVWSYGVGMAAAAAAAVAWLFKSIAMEEAYDNKKVSTASYIRQSIYEDSIMGASAMLAKYMQKSNWKWAQWDRATQEEKETKLEELMAEIEEWDAEKMAEMEGEMKEEMSEDEAVEEEAEEEEAEEEEAEEKAAEEDVEEEAEDDF